MKTKQYRKRDADIAWQAVEKCYHGKWSRNDVLCDIEEWTGYDRRQIWEIQEEDPEHAYRIKYEIMEERAKALDDMIDEIEMGIDPDFDPVLTRRRPDKGTGKLREIAYLCIRMQLLGHYIQLGLEPLLKARILPWQHASIPGRGPRGLTRQLQRKLRKKLGIRYYIKSDCKSAYGTTMYAKMREIIQREIPGAEWIHKAMALMEKYAPGGHLIIGGYLDAWLFNYAISYAIRYVMAIYKSRRGNRIPMVIASTAYMDDAIFLGANRKGMQAAVRRCGEYMTREHGIQVKATTGAIRLWDAEDEKAHKHMARPAKRGCPMVDTAGYRVGKTHTTLRRRNARKSIRSFTRAWREYQRTGTLKRQRAMEIISRNGLMANCNSYRMKDKYHVYELLRVAKRIVAYWGRVEQRKREETRRHAVSEYRKQRQAPEGYYCAAA